MYKLIYSSLVFDMIPQSQDVILGMGSVLKQLVPAEGSTHTFGITYETFAILNKQKLIPAFEITWFRHFQMLTTKRLFLCIYAVKTSLYSVGQKFSCHYRVLCF